jgi:hypothetical protein
VKTTLKERYTREGAGGVLAIFGLERIITDDDDPELWAAVLIRHWKPPDDPECLPASLRFGIGRCVPEGEKERSDIGRSGMAEIAVWCFDEVAPGRLQPAICPAAAAPSFMFQLMTGGGAGSDDGAESMVRTFLDVSRPSRGDFAFVHSGFVVPPNAGQGQTRRWQKTGIWMETDELFAQWLT